MMGGSSRWKRETLPEPFYHEAGEGGGKAATMGVRKYLLLLQDSIAVKFVADKSAERGGGKDVDERGGGRGGLKGRVYSAAAPPPSTLVRNNNNNNNSSSGISGGEEPYQGFFLFQAFREVNLKSYWNPPIVHTFEKLEYAGFISPSTIFISSLRKFLHVLRSAWARQLIRSPPGYRIEFMGDVEELICEPIQQSYFSPLSDSLCWAIMEMSSRGEEAFLDTICADLEQNFPWMVQPNPELVYKTLEKLVQERKVYQTARGYFIVTPDTLRYMTGGQQQQHQHQGVRAGQGLESTHSLQSQPPAYGTLPHENLNGTHHHHLLHHQLSSPQIHGDSASSGGAPGVPYCHHPFEPRPTSPSQEDGDSGPFSVHSLALPRNHHHYHHHHHHHLGRASSGGGGGGGLTRHNSLKLFRRRDSHLDNPALFGGKSLSFRLSRGRAFSVDMDNGCGDPYIQASSSSSSRPPPPPPPMMEQSPRISRKKGTKEGFLSKIFGFRSFSRTKRLVKDSIGGGGGGSGSSSSGKKQEKRAKEDESSGGAGAGAMDSSSKRDSYSQYDILGNSSGNSMRDDLESGCSSTIILDSASSTAAARMKENDFEFGGMVMTSRPRWNSLPKRNYRTSSRRSILTMVDDNVPLYATASVLHHPGSDAPTNASSISFTRAQSSRSSTLSQGTGSLGYGSQGPQSFATAASLSPCPSLSNASSGTYATLSGGGNPASSSDPSKSRGGAEKREDKLAQGHHTGGGGGGSSGKVSVTPANNGAPAPKSYSDVYRARHALYGSHLGRRSSSPMPVGGGGWNDGMNINNNSKPVYETIRDDRAKRASIGCVDRRVAKTVANATVTQSLESTNNLSVELLVGRRDGGATAPTERGRDSVTQDASSINVSIGDTQIRLPKHPSAGGGGLTHITTSLNDKGQMETQFDCTHGPISSKIQIKSEATATNSSGSRSAMSPGTVIIDSSSSSSTSSPERKKSGKSSESSSSSCEAK